MCVCVWGGGEGEGEGGGRGEFQLCVEVSCLFPTPLQDVSLGNRMYKQTFSFPISAMYRQKLMS